MTMRWVWIGCRVRDGFHPHKGLSTVLLQTITAAAMKTLQYVDHLYVFLRYVKDMLSSIVFCGRLRLTYGPMEVGSNKLMVCRRGLFKVTVPRLWKPSVSYLSLNVNGDTTSPNLDEVFLYHTWLQCNLISATIFIFSTEEGFETLEGDASNLMLYMDGLVTPSHVAMLMYGRSICRYECSLSVICLEAEYVFNGNEVIHIIADAQRS